MFYCTIYEKYTAKNSWRAAYCLAYASEADAKNYAATLAEQAVDCGAQVEEHDSAYIITGTTHFCPGGFCNSSRLTFYYMVKVEDKASRFSMSPDNEISEHHIEDGYKFEERATRYRNKLSAERNKEREKINYNLSRFEQEIADETNLTKILTTLLKYAHQKTDKQKLIDLAVKKIQGGNSSGWYDELSNINK